MSLRAYQPIWEKLKADGIVSITANRLLHPRIVKAVTKEKWLDFTYKQSVQPAIAILSHTSKFSVLTFSLKLRQEAIPDLRIFNGIGDFRLNLLLEEVMSKSAATPPTSTDTPNIPKPDQGTDHGDS